jgi:hypothetical protein
VGRPLTWSLRLTFVNHDDFPYPAASVAVEEELVRSTLIAFRHSRAFTSYACRSARASRNPLK